MLRKIVSINEEKCNGCGLCAAACHENAIVIENGKARLVKEDFCDGFGDCLPACPQNAIKIEERECAAYDEKAVEKRKMELASEKIHAGSGCPGNKLMTFRPVESTAPKSNPASGEPVSQLQQWPVQIKLLPVQAPFYDKCRLLVAADCCAYAYANFHEDFMKNRITLIGCPKLDNVDYSEKLTQIIALNDIKSVTVLRMEVPCCGGIENAVKKALMSSGKMIPWNVVTVSRDGRILSD